MKVSRYECLLLFETERASVESVCSFFTVSIHTVGVPFVSFKLNGPYSRRVFLIIVSELATVKVFAPLLDGSDHVSSACFCLRLNGPRSESVLLFDGQNVCFCFDCEL